MKATLWADLVFFTDGSAALWAGHLELGAAFRTARRFFVDGDAAYRAKRLVTARAIVNSSFNGGPTGGTAPGILSHELRYLPIAVEVMASCQPSAMAPILLDDAELPNLGPRESEGVPRRMW